MQSYYQPTTSTWEPLDTLLIPFNRGVRFGDGLFETIVVREGNVIALDLHLARAALGCRMLRLEPQSVSELENIQSYISGLGVNFNNGVARWYCWRVGEGSYKPESGSCFQLLTFESLELPLSIQWVRGGVNSLSYSPGLLGEIKTLSNISYVLAAQDAEEQGFELGLLANKQYRVIESMRGNLLFGNGGDIFSIHPKLNPKRGVAIQLVANELSQAGIKAEPVELLLDDLEKVEWMVSLNVRRCELFYSVEGVLTTFGLPPMPVIRSLEKVYGQELPPIPIQKS
jgi:4-amino-4-deoxychorismate lyase